MPYKKWNSGSSKFDEAKMLKEVFPGTTATSVDEILQASTINTSSTGSNPTSESGKNKDPETPTHLGN